MQVIPSTPPTPPPAEQFYSAYYDAAMGHNVISISDDDAEILWVTSLG